MPAGPMNRVFDHVRRTTLRGTASDAELLARFVERHDAEAFATLVHRHGPMVWGVCARQLSHHDAEDAFQATFVVLVRKSAAVVPREMIGNWLYGVAHRTALLARRTVARRRAREGPAADTEAPPVRPPEALPVLDQELSRLPDIYRAVVVLCDLEGRTRKEAAGLLGVPEGTVGGRLARARALLAKRLGARGVTTAGGVLAALLAPRPVAASALDGACSVATGEIPATVAALTNEVISAMTTSKFKTVVAAALVLGFVTTGATFLTSRTTAALDDKKPAAAPAAPQKEPQKGEKLSPEVAGQLKWGEAVKGLRAAVAIRAVPGAKADALPDLYLVVQNAGKTPLRFSNATEAERPGMLDTRGDGEIKARLGFKWPTAVDVVLQPNEVVFLPMFSLDPPPDGKPTVGAVVADDIVKLPRYSFVAHLDIVNPPSGAWAGNLKTGDANGKAAHIKPTPPGEKK